MRVKVVRQITRRGGTEYVSYKITLPKNLVESLGFSELNELELSVQVVNGEPAIILRKPK